MYYLSGFDVTRSNPNCNLSDFNLSIRFIDHTSFAEITDHVNLIPFELFRFDNEEKLLDLANTNTHLLGWSLRFCFYNREFKYIYVVIVFVFCADIIGQFTTIKSTRHMT